MKTTWDELMRYAPEQEIPLPSMQDGECARILNKTMEKIKAYPVKAINDHWFLLPNGTKIELKLLENWKVNK